MKKLLFVLFISLFLIPRANASHVLGGEISWRCLNNGQFIFYMSVYRDCTGTTFPYNVGNGIIEIFGAPLPRNAGNAPISQITLRPDSQRWLVAKNGDTSPNCDPLSPTPMLNCANGDPGTVQQFFYASDPITLRGVPPASGWHFRWQGPCCRPDVENLQNASSNTMILRATMYPDANNTNTYPCHDSSPEFLALPTNLICRGYEFTYNHTAVDRDLDSLLYSFDRTLNVPISSPSNQPYKNPFTPNAPTPGPSFNPNNITCTIDQISGAMTVALYSGVGQPADRSDYLTVVRVDSWRGGKIIASVYREIPFVFFDCPRLDGGRVNNPPEVFINGVPAKGLVTEVTAGQTVRVPFQAIDRDIKGYGTGLQKVTVVPAGFMFSTAPDVSSPNQCQTDDIEPCAILDNVPATLNSSAQPPQPEVSGLTAVSTELVWTPTCDHLKVPETGLPGAYEGIFNFVMRVYDDHCPIPGINYPTITVRVKEPFPLTEPIVKGASVDLNGRLKVSWVPPMDSATTFNRYGLEEARTIDGVNPSIYQLLNPYITTYQQERSYPNYQLFYPGANTQPNILDKIVNRDWYFRMYAESGCRETSPSEKSDAVRIMEIETTPIGPAVAPSSLLRLDWNSPKRANALTYPYFVYESETHYYIWENDSIELNGVFNAGEAEDPQNWYIRGDTDATSFYVNSNICNGRPGFRIEARDTVITYKQGYAPRYDSLDTLTFSTFSIIDTAFMEQSPNFFPSPRFDTIEVMANGDILLKIDRGSAGTVSAFKLYDSTATSRVLLDSFPSSQDTFLLSGSGYDGRTNDYGFILESINACNNGDPNDPNYSRESYYTSFVPQGRIADSCDGTYRISLNKPQGFPNGVAGYRIYLDTSKANGANGPYQLVASVNNGNQDSVDVGIFKNTYHYFKVVAYDDRGDVIIGRTQMDSIQFRTREIVRPPLLRCTYVEDDGSVTMTMFFPDDRSRDGADHDTTENWTGFEFEYRLNGGSWQAFAGSDTVVKSDETIHFPNVNANQDFVEFRARSISGCTGFEPSDWSPVLQIIDIEATAFPQDTLKRVEISWNDHGAAVSGSYRFHSRFDTLPVFDSLNGPSHIDVPVSSFMNSRSRIDTNSSSCNEIGTYYVEVDHPSQACISRSNVDSAVIRDYLPPKMQVVDVVTVNPQTGKIEVYWSEDNGDVYAVLPIEPQVSGNFAPLGDRILWTANSVVIEDTVLDPTDTTVTVGLQAISQCGRENAVFDFHTTMDVDVEWVECDSVNILDWNPYTDFNEGGDNVTYEVYVDAGGTGNFTLVSGSETVDTTFEHKILNSDLRYYYYIKATNGTNTFSSTSNVDSDTVFYADQPLYGYLNYATVLPTNEVEVSMFKDTSIIQGAYSLYRGTEKESMNPIDRVEGSEVFKDELITFIDPSAITTDYSYFYKVVTENLCGNLVDESNYGRTIHLTVEADNEALTNTLRWNEYQEWDSTVAYYNIYRGFNGAAAQEVYAVVPPTENGDPNLYVDDVYDNSLADGSYCYKVVAVQGPVTDDFPNELEAATSTSNEVCVTQQPLFYIPNAFAPEGKNKVFAPKGQFFDFSLYEMAIYNRWGEQVFISRDINLGWDGTINGEAAPLGSYVYTIRFVDANGNEHRRKGTVTLVR